VKFPFAFLKPLLFLIIFGLFVSSVRGDQVAEMQTEMQEVLMQCQSAHYRLVDYRGVLRHEVVEGGQTVREDEIEVTFRKPSFLALHWKNGLFNGTTLLSRPAWNRGNLLIHLGEWFDFVTLNLPSSDIGEPFTPGLRDLSEWLTALSMLAQRVSAADRSLRQVKIQTHDPSISEDHVVLVVPAFLVPFRDNRVSTYEFVIERGTGMPVELVLRGSGGEVQQRSVFRDLQVNTGVSTQSFEWEEKTEGARSLPREEAEIDVRGFIQNWQHRYVEISDYTGEWVLEERWGNILQKSAALFKFRKPFDVYLAWAADGQRGNSEELFRQGWNNERVRVRTTFGGMPLIGDIEPQSYLARWGHGHSLTEFGLNRLVEMLQDQLLREWLRGHLHVAFRGLHDYGGQFYYEIEFSFTRDTENENTPARIVTYWDIAARLPIQYESFDWADQLLERLEFRQLHLNVSLRDSDFDAANPTYGFLLFPHMPQLDRFLTGRE
jgi:outer membrane lipoprotein-sorting protein